MKLITLLLTLGTAFAALAADSISTDRPADQRKLDGPRYEVNHVWGEGPHSDNHGGVLLPDMLRWIWKDYAK